MRAVAALVLAFGVAGCSGRSATSCADLKTLSLGDATITKAQAVAAGRFAIPAADPGARAESIILPAFCRVQGVIEPAKDSHIEFEVWLPASAEGSGAAGSGWNGKYQGVGNGAFAGAIEYVGDGGALASALKAGYAASSTDTGHRADGADARWALGHPEKIVDYGYRAIHETAEKAKIIIRAFYGEPARHSYFSACSNGGRQALMEAQRYRPIMAASSPARPPRTSRGSSRPSPGMYWPRLSIRRTTFPLESLPRLGPRPSRSATRTMV